jgi:transcriptional regulator with PAS, ATPase and Fis domain
MVEHRLPVVQGRVDRQSVLHAFRDLWQDTEPVVAEPSSPPHAAADEPPLGSLTGISRRFETNSPQLKQMLLDLEVAARHDVTILLIGETGAGKTYLARLIHEVSPRRMEPFLPVACGALPNDLIESELFGHVKGSFTSAHQDKEGKFIAARRGSILLDEIDVLGLEQQVKLLRVIETGEFEPVGSNQTQHSKARLIVASNLDLQPLVEQHRFRPDLYYRLNMLKFVIPPLRQRKMDIVPLVRKFIGQFSVKHGVRIEHVDPAVFQALLEYPWPGNVRELEHVVQRAVIYCRGGTLEPQHLPGHILSGTAGPTNDPTVILPGGSPAVQPVASIHSQSLGGQMALTEKEIIEQTLFKNSFSRTKSARELGISRVTLYNKMKKYGMLK